MTTTSLSTAAFSWTDMWPDCYGDHQLLNADRGDLPWRSPVLQQASIRPEVGGLLLWNKTLDLESGRVVMFTGQERDQEQRVMRNATWMISCGAAYAAKRVGWKSYKSSPDHRVRIGDHRYLVWLLRTDIYEGR